jgi:DegV family protein with EDD domain
MTVQVVTDSTADLSPEAVRDLGIHVVPLNVHFGDTVYKDGVDLSTDEFLTKLAASPRLPTTSQPSAGAFSEVYRRLSQEGKEILSVHISSKLSGTVSSALLAKDMVSDTGCRIEVVDSTVASMGLGLHAIEVARAAKDGATLDEVASLLRHDLIPRTHIVLFVDTLEYLQKGGRIGRAQAFLGTMLSVKPMLTVTDGEIHPLERVRTRSRAVERLHEYVGEFSSLRHLAVFHSTTPDEAQALAERLSVFHPQETHLGKYGPVIATHIGPGAMGVIVIEGSGT